MKLAADGRDTERAGLDETLLQPAYQRVAAAYRRQRRSEAFACPAALTAVHGTALAEYYDVWHTLGLTYREADPHSSDFLARGRHALDK